MNGAGDAWAARAASACRVRKQGRRARVWVMHACKSALHCRRASASGKTAILMVGVCGCRLAAGRVLECVCWRDGRSRTREHAVTMSTLQDDLYGT